MPVSARVCGLPGALSVTDTLAVRLPPAVGVKVTETVHEPPAGTVVGATGQVLVWAKSPALVSVMAIPLIDSGAVPVLVNVTLCAALAVPTPWLVNDREGGLSVAAGAAAAVAVPVRAAVCGLPVALSVTERFPVRLPEDVGEKVTLIAQLAPAARVVVPMGRSWSAQSRRRSFLSARSR